MKRFATALLTYVFCTNNVEGVHINLVTITVGNNPTYGYRTAAPLFDVSLEYLARKFPNVYRNFSRISFFRPTKPVSPTCPQSGDEMYSVLGEMYDLVEGRDGLTILFTTGCSLEAMTLAEFAREMNVPAILSSAADPAFTNAKRFPTAVTFGPAGEGNQGPAIRAFLSHFAWTTVTVYCDLMSQFPALSAFCSIACRSIKANLGSVNGQFNVLQEEFDSKGFERTDYTRLLNTAKIRSRVILLVTRENIMRQFLITANLLRMDASEYAFLYVRPVLGPSSLDLTWEMNDGMDQLAYESFHGLIVLNFISPNWDVISDILYAQAERSERVYNYSFSPDEKRYKYIKLAHKPNLQVDSLQHNDVAVALFEGLYALSYVLNDSLNVLSNITARQLKSHFINRTFDLPSRQVTVGRNGMRIADSIFSRFNYTTNDWQVAWRFNFFNGQLVIVSDMAEIYEPVANIPRCGFLNDRCRLRESDSPLYIGLSVVAVAVLIGAILTFRKLQESSREDPTKWELSTDDLTQPTVSLHQRRDSILPPPENIILHLTYKNASVWCRTIPSSKASNHPLPRRVCAILSKIQSIQHKNIARLFGVGRMDDLTLVVWELGRQVLRSLFSHEKLSADEDLQISVLRNVINGLLAVHKSPLRYHGNLSALTIVLDSRFTAKLCDVASFRICHLLGHPSYPLDASVFYSKQVAETRAGSPADDKYALGTVIKEILLQRPVTFKDIELSRMSIFAGQETGTITRKNFATFCDDISQQCTAPDASSRPLLKDILSRLARFHRGNKSVVEIILKRLARHAETLEDSVAYRTQELIVETRKSDALLAEIIPPELVQRLRNRQPTPPEFFDSVTVLFTSLTGFDTFCSQSGPLAIVILLNDLYVFLDGLLGDFDVYKVETIKDGYVVASGLPKRNGAQHAKHIALLSLHIIRAVSKENDNARLLPIRCGFHTGPCVAAVVGQKLPRYCLFGDTMNTASRMESNGQSMKVHVSISSKCLLELSGRFRFRSRGLMEIKGKGRMETFWLTSVKGAMRFRAAVICLLAIRRFSHFFL